VCGERTLQKWHNGNLDDVHVKKKKPNLPMTFGIPLHTRVTKKKRAFFRTTIKKKANPTLPFYPTRSQKPPLFSSFYQHLRPRILYRKQTNPLFAATLSHTFNVLSEYIKNYYSALGNVMVIMSLYGYTIRCLTSFFFFFLGPFFLS